MLFAGGTALASTHTARSASWVTGREVITHDSHESYAEATKPGELLPLRLHGVVRTRGGIDLGGQSRNREISTRKGSLDTVSTHRAIFNKVLSFRSCHLQTTVVDHLFVDGRRSSGAFFRASGHGTAVVRFRFFFPKVHGRCDFHDAAKGRGGRVAFLLVIPRLTVR